MNEEISAFRLLKVEGSDMRVYTVLSSYPIFEVLVVHRAWKSGLFMTNEFLFNKLTEFSSKKMFFTKTFLKIYIVL